MTIEAYTLLEVLAAALIASLITAGIMAIATASTRHAAHLDRLEAAEDLAAAKAAQIRMEAARSMLTLAPAYGADTGLMPVVEADPDPVQHDEAADAIAYENAMVELEAEQAVEFSEWLADANAAAKQHVAEQVDVDAGLAELKQRAAELVPACCTGHGDEPCDPGSDLVPPYCCGDCPARVPAAEVVPVTAAELSPIGPDRMPRMRWWGWPLMAVLLVVALLIAVVVGLVELGAVCRERLAAWWQHRAAGAVELELEHPAPAVAYRARHLAPAGRWWWSR